MIGLLATALAAGLNMPCEQLQTVPLERATVVTAATVAAGVFTSPAGSGPGGTSAPPPQPIPAHCRVTMVLEPTTDSNINVELWLPTRTGTGSSSPSATAGGPDRFRATGDMPAALRRGYATGGTDTGHSAADGPDGMFALGHPEKIVDFAYRAIHEMTVKSKLLVDAFYEEPLEYSYFKGCSTGGRKA